MARRVATVSKPTRKRPRRRTAERNAPVGNPPPWIPVERTNLTAEERRLLPDPTRLTEDDADALSVIRSEMRDEPTVSLEEALDFLFGKGGRRRK